MKRLLTILLFAVLISLFSLQKKRAYSVYTWDSTNTNINITNSTFGTPLVAGDIVHIPVRAGGAGYRSFSFSGLNSGAAGAYITIVFDDFTYIQPSSSSLQANFMDNCKGVHIIKMRMDDHVDAAMRLGSTGYSSWIWWDSCHFRGTPGFGPVANGSLPSFGGDSTKMHHHWRFHKCVWDSCYTGTGGGIALALGGNAAGALSSNGWWRDCIIDSCYFANYNSEHIGGTDFTSNYIRLLQAINNDIYGNRFINLGVSPHPPGHATCVVTLGSKYTAHDNFFGPFNFGNDLRDLGPIDMPMWGGVYVGRSSFYNNISVDKRKYPVFDTRTIDPTSLSTLSPYVQSRAMAFVWNITAYNMAVGAGGNGPYETNIVDMGASDSLFLKNSVLVGIRDTTWGTSFGPFLWSQAGSPIANFDTSNNRLVQLWVNSGIRDSSTFTPIIGGLLNGHGTTVPGFIMKDYYGNPRTINGLVDIGAVQYLLITCNCLTSPIKIKVQ